MEEERKILVIDDELGIRASFCRILEPQGYKVYVAASVQEGLNEAKKEHFDLAFVDIIMPEMDGIAATERLREICPELKIVLMTAYADDEHIKMGLNSGLEVFALLRKPLDIIEINDIVKRAMQQ